MAVTPAETANPATPRRLTDAAYDELALRELDAFLALLDTLGEDDWTKQTPCDRWNVRDVVAHQGGHVQMGAGLQGLIAQTNPFVMGRYFRFGAPLNDAINQAQVERRRSLPIVEIVREVREGTPRAIARRGRMRAITANAFRVPVPPIGLMTVGELLHRIFPRDMWVHRLDIADATGRPFEQSAERDGVLLADTVAHLMDLAPKQARGLTITLQVEGTGGGTWTFGTGPKAVHLMMTLPDFIRISSGRIPLTDALTRVHHDADALTARRAVLALTAPY